MGKAQDFLMDAFAGESQANRRYLAFAKKADDEGHPQVARLFRAAAAAETVHAHNHLRAWGGIRSTAENLKEAIAGETHEFTTMYPEMIEAAKAEGHEQALRSFNFANAVEKVHAKQYHELLGDLGSGGDEFSYYVCPVCGFTAEREAPGTCPICATKGDRFEKMS